MKHLLLVLAIASQLFITEAFAQTRGFSYQAVMRDAGGQISANTNATIRFTISEGVPGPTALIVYRETQAVTTNDYGVINATIGAGTVVAGNFNTINWLDDAHYLVVELDDNGSWVSLSQSELVAVPYAKVAETAEGLVDPDWERNGNNIENTNVGSVFIHDVTIYTGSNSTAMKVDSMMSFGNGSQLNYVYTNSDGQLGFKPNSPGSSPVMTIDDDGAGVEIDEELTVSDGIKVLNNTASPEGRTLYGNSMPLAYGYISGINILRGYGVSSVSSPATGVWVVTLSNGFSGYPVVVATAVDGINLEHAVFADYSASNNTITINTFDAAGNPVVTNFTFAAFGTPDL